MTEMGERLSAIETRLDYLSEAVQKNVRGVEALNSFANKGRGAVWAFGCVYTLVILVVGAGLHAWLGK